MFEDSAPTRVIKSQTQILEPVDLTKGRIVKIRREIGPPSEKVEIIRPPYVKNTSIWIGVLYLEGEKKGSVCDLSLKDLGFYPYMGSVWNPYNWIERA